MTGDKQSYYKDRIREFSKLGKESIKKGDFLSAKMYINFARGFAIKLEKARKLVKELEVNNG